MSDIGDRRQTSWHLDPESLRKVVITIAAGLLVQTVGLVGSAIWWVSGTEHRMVQHEVMLTEHARRLEIQNAAGERLARLEEITRRLERITERIEAERRK